jgi:hypothetical protein
MRSKIKSDFTEREKQGGEAVEEFSLEDEVFETPKRQGSKTKSSKFHPHQLIDAPTKRPALWITHKE